MAIGDEDSTGFDATAEKRVARDRDDLNIELAGLDVGRIKRFLPKDANPSFAEQQAKSERLATLTALQMLMLQDAEYAALRLRVQDRLANAEQRLAELHLEAEAMLAESAARLEALEAQAGTLPDGTKVFRSASGDVFTQDGRALDAEERAEVSWKDGAPSWEEYREAKDRHEALEQYRDKIETTQGEVDAHNDTLANDSDDPTTGTELNEIEQGTKDAISELEQTRAKLLAAPQDPQPLAEKFNSSAPQLDFGGLAASPESGSAQQAL